jgi:hypothetical protein
MYEKRRLHLCNEAIKKHKIVKSTKRGGILDGLAMKCIKLERRELLRKERLRQSDDALFWSIRDASDDFIFSSIVERLHGEKQKALDNALQLICPDKASRDGYIEQIKHTMVPLRAVDGGIYVAALEGHPAGVERFVGYFDLTGNNGMHAYEGAGLEKCSSVRLLPVSELVMPARDRFYTGFSASPMMCAHYEMHEQVYLHGINKVHCGFHCPEGIFNTICAEKRLCTRCGEGKHHTECLSKRKAAWAGGGDL